MTEPASDALVLFGATGDHTLFGSYDGIEAAWRIVEHVLNSNSSVHEYDCGSSGPAEALSHIAEASWKHSR